MDQKMDLSELIGEWEVAKAAEKSAMEKRRIVEDQIVMLARIPDGFDGVKTIGDGNHQLKATGRINRAVDGDMAQEIAADFGLTQHLSTLFSWKPTVNVRAWKNTSKEITSLFADAITAKPGRVSFSIVEKKGE